MFNSVVLFLSTLLSSLFNRGVYEERFVIDTDITPAYVYWIDNSKILVSDYDRSYSYDLESREKEIISDSLVGYGKSGFVFCEYENKDINSMEESSTFITLRDSEGEVFFQTDMFPTVRPVMCSFKRLLVKNSYSFLENLFLEIDIENGDYNRFEIEPMACNYKGVEDCIMSTVSKDKRYLVVLDRFNRLVLYQKE